MRKNLRKLVIIAIFCCLAFVQPTQSIIKVSKTPANDTTITAKSYSTEVNAAQITAVNLSPKVSAARITVPTTFPIQDERKADSTFLTVGELIFKDTLYVDPDPPRKITFESAGFLYVRKYQSSYVPTHI